MADDEFIITLKIEVECYIVFFSLPKFALYSVQRNFMASKSFKVGFSMNIKMMLFHQFVILLHLDFLLLFACSSHLLYPPMSNTPCYCKIVKSNTASPPLSFSSESCSAANSTKLCSAPAEKSRKETEGNPYWMVLASNSTKPL